MVSYSRLRPAMSRDEPIRWFFGAAAGVAAVGVALARGGSVPVVLIGSPSGRLARVATDKELLLEGAVSTTSPPRCLRLLLIYFCLPLKRFMAGVSPSLTMDSTASAARAM